MLLDYANPDSVAKNIRLVTEGLRVRRDSLHRCHCYQCCSPLDVRLVSNPDGELWFATGNVQYDTTHGSACESCEIEPSTTDEELAAIATDLVNGVADQLAELQEVK